MGVDWLPACPVTMVRRLFLNLNWCLSFNLMGHPHLCWVEGGELLIIRLNLYSTDWFPDWFIMLLNKSLIRSILCHVYVISFIATHNRNCLLYLFNVSFCDLCLIYRSAHGIESDLALLHSFWTLVKSCLESVLD